MGQTQKLLCLLHGPAPLWPRHVVLSKGDTEPSSACPARSSIPTLGGCPLVPAGVAPAGRGEGRGLVPWLGAGSQG